MVNFALILNPAHPAPKKHGFFVCLFVPCLHSSCPTGTDFSVNLFWSAEIVLGLKKRENTTSSPRNMGHTENHLIQQLSKQRENQTPFVTALFWIIRDTGCYRALYLQHCTIFYKHRCDTFSQRDIRCILRRFNHRYCQLMTG